MNILSIYEKYFAKDYLFLVAYSLIHFVLISYAYLNIQNTYTPPVFYKFTIFGTNTNILDMYNGIEALLYSYLAVLIIFIIDVAFLIVCMFEFQWLRLNYRKVLFLEFGLIIISFIFPFFREIMFFMSFNTVGIYIIYRILLKNIWFLRFPFIFSSYIFLIKLILTPVYILIKLRLTI